MWTFNVGDVKNKLEIGQSGGIPYSYDLIPHSNRFLRITHPMSKYPTASIKLILLGSIGFITKPLQNTKMQQEVTQQLSFNIRRGIR